MAGTKSRHSSKTILLALVPGTYTPRRTALGIITHARQIGWELILQQMPDARHLSMPEELGAQGAILVGLPADQHERFARSSCPVVGVEIHTHECPFPTVNTDNRALGKLAAEYYLQQGYRRFGYAPSGRVTYDVREIGFRETIEAAGGEVKVLPQGLQLRRQSWREVMRRTARWLKEFDTPAAILAANDENAHAILHACRVAELAVPEQIAVLGVHDDEIMCVAGPVELSSVVFSGEAIGRRAVELMQELLRGGKTRDQRIYMPPTGVVTRRSTDFVAIEDAAVANAAKWIRSHFAQPISPEKVAVEAGFSRSALDRRFRRVLHRTVHDEIVRHRVLRAKELLAGTDMGIDEVAQRSGFRTREYLSVVVKKETGLWPAAYRRTNRHVR